MTTETVSEIAAMAKAASLQLAHLSTDTKNRTLGDMASALEKGYSSILQANAKDLEFAERENIPGPLIARLRLNENKVIGMAGALDSSRFRTFLAMETGYSVQDINCMVLGGHGDTMVPITRLATIGGIPAEELIPKDRLEAIVDRVRYAGGEIVKLFGNGSAYYAPASSAIEMAESYLKDKKRVIPSAALCEGEFGVDGYFIGVPTVIGAGGIEKILEFKLLPHEQEMLNKTLQEVEKTVAETKL